MLDVKESYNAHAGQWTTRLSEGKNPAHSLLEKPAMLSMLPPLENCRILALGCGSGEELALLIQRGADESGIVGIDVSTELLDRARAAYPLAKFELRSMEQLDDYADNSFDFIYSSLTLHYALDWRPVLSAVRRVLKPGGQFLFSTHHPLKWGAQVTRSAATDTFFMGYERPKEGAPTVHGDYLGSREIHDLWFGNMPVTYYHRPLSAIMADILASGLQITEFAEPAPVPEAAMINPGFHAIHSRIPMFMIFRLKK